MQKLHKWGEAQNISAFKQEIGEGVLWRVGKFKPLFLTKRKYFFLLFSLIESQ